MNQQELNTEQRTAVLASLRGELDDVKVLLKQLSRRETNDQDQKANS